GALVAYPQPDMKRLVAYSSVSHMGFVMLGLYAFNSTGITGGVLQMVNHGLSTGALFILVGLIYDRTHTREISQYGGIWGTVPLWSAFFLVVTLSSIGLPGLNGFVGEFLILSGAFRSHPTAAVVGTTGIILGAVYMLTMYQRVAFGPVTREANRSLADLNRREVFVAASMVLFMVWIGLYPRPFIERIEPTVGVLLGRLQRAGATRHLELPRAPLQARARRGCPAALDPRWARGNNSPLPWRTSSPGSSGVPTSARSSGSGHSSTRSAGSRTPIASCPIRRSPLARRSGWHRSPARRGRWTTSCPTPSPPCGKRAGAPSGSPTPTCRA